MAFPAGFPVDSQVIGKPVRYYRTAAASGAYTDNGYIFVDTAGAQIPSGVISLAAVGGAINFSFDGTTDHGYVASGTTLTMQRREGCIAIKGAGTFHLTVW